VWQRQSLEITDDLELQLNYWRSNLSGAPDLLSLPTDFIRKANRSRLAGHIPINISSVTAASLDNLSLQHETTLFNVLISIYGLLLGRLARQDEVVIGFPVEGRQAAEVESLVGFLH